MPPVLSLVCIRILTPIPSAISSLCRSVLLGVFKMTQIEFQKLDEIRQKDERLFEKAVDLLFSIGVDHLTEEIATEMMREAKEDFDVDSSSVEDMFILTAKMLVLGAALEIRTVSLETLLDYIAENGWRRHDRR